MTLGIFLSMAFALVTTFCAWGWTTMRRFATVTYEEGTEDYDKQQEMFKMSSREEILRFSKELRYCTFGFAAFTVLQVILELNR